MKSMNKSELTPDQVAALEVLLSGGTQEEAANACGVARTTIGTWLHNGGAFEVAYKDRLKALGSQVTERVLALAGEALNVVREIMVQNDAPPANRLSAAKLILDRISATKSDVTLTLDHDAAAAHLAMVERVSALIGGLRNSTDSEPE
jgi:hypothetical protein